MNKMKVAIILGTRPEIVKFAPIIRECEKRELNYFIVHTGQHYDYLMDKVFFEDLKLPQPKYNLKVGSGLYGEQLNKMISRLKDVLKKENPDIVLVLGDTSTTLAGMLTAHYLGIKVGHIESGLRSYEIMFEEVHRVITGILSDYLFVPTEKAKENLIKEGIKEDKIFITGNSIVDATYQNMKLTNENVLKKLNLKPKDYIVVTAHRPEYVDKKDQLSDILKALDLLSKKHNIVFPLHPRTRKNIEKFNLKIPENVKIIEPLGYLDFLNLMMNSKLILTDSGGVQEESCIIKKPCVTLRDATERPETIEVGSNILAGTNPEKIIESVNLMLKKEPNWQNPFGDGNTSERILDIIKDNYKNTIIK